MNFSGKLQKIQEDLSKISWKVVGAFAVPIIGFSLLMMGLASLTLGMLNYLETFPIISAILIVVTPIFLGLPVGAFWVPPALLLVVGLLLEQEFLFFEAVVIGMIFGLGGAYLREKLRVAIKIMQLRAPEDTILIVSRCERESSDSPMSIIRSYRPYLLKQDFPPTSIDTQEMVRIIQEVFDRFLQKNLVVQNLKASTWRNFILKDYQAVTCVKNQPIWAHPQDSKLLFSPFVTLPLEFNLKGLFQIKLHCLANSWSYNQDQFLLSGNRQFFDYEEFCDQVKGLNLPKDEDLFTYAIMAHTSPLLEKHGLALLKVEVLSWEPDISVTL